MIISKYSTIWGMAMLLLWPFLVTCQAYTISGYIEDDDTGEKLIAANVFDEVSLDGTISNTFGFYSITLPAGQINLKFSYIGYQDQSSYFVLQRDTVMNISLSQSVELETITITAEESKSIAEETQMSVAEIPIAQIKNVPALLGEVDVLKALQLLPGVQSGGEGQSGLYVRGGSPDQNLILLDGTPVYNASHLFGFFSVFNADAIKDVKLIKGGFPARYGGRLSSVLEINMKEGSNKGFHGSGAIGLVSSKLTLEGPIMSEKTSFIVSGRRTYIDILARPFIKRGFEDEGQEGNTGYYFYDINAKINHVFSSKDRVYLSMYTGDDRFYFNSREQDDAITNDYTENNLGWGNLTSALRWNHVWSPKLFSNTTATLSKYELDTFVSFGEEDVASQAYQEISLDYVSGINDVSVKIDFDYLPNPNHFIRFGASVILHEFKPGTFGLRDFNSGSTNNFELEVGQDDIRANEYAMYIEDDWKISDKFKTNVGLHASAFHVDGKLYNSLQPRISSRYLINDELSVKASFATMRQYIHLLSLEGIGLPTDLWLPTTEKVAPQNSYQFAAGIAKNFGKKYEFSVEGYYKKMENLISYKDGSGLFEFTDWQDRITQGDGDSYGAEFFLQKKQGRFSGWLGYTLSWTNRQFDDLNFGEEFPYRYDRRHDLSVVGQYKWKDGIQLSAAWVFGTGNAVTLANSQVVGYFGDTQNQTGTFGDFDSFLENFYAEKNNFRMGSYHRLDVGINFIKKKKNYSRTWSIGAYNTYARKNPFFLYQDTFYDGVEDQYRLRRVSLFPMIPYVTYSFEF